MRSPVLTIFKKELARFFGDRRMALTTILLPGLMIYVLYTFMGNALACAVALKGIEIFERENYMEKIKKIEEISKREMLGFSDERIKEVRVMGGCTCVEVYDPKTLEGFQQYAYERGVFSRPFLSYMYSMVPYVIEEDELVQIFTVMKDWFRRG